MEANYHQIIGDGYYISITRVFQYVNLRRYALSANGRKENATRYGIALTLDEWDTLVIRIREVNKLLHLKSVKPCETV